MTRRSSWSIYSIGHPSVGTFKDRPDKISVKQFGLFLLTLVFAMVICGLLLLMTVKYIDTVERDPNAENEMLEDYDDLEQLLLSDIPIL